MMEATRRPHDKFVFLAITVLIVVIFINLGIPEAWETSLVVSGIHLYYALAVFLYPLIAYTAFRRKVFSGPIVYIYVVCLITVYMTGLGVLQRGMIIFEWRILFYDVFVLGALISGMLFTVSQPPSRVLKVIRITCFIWLACLIMDSTLLQLGVILPAWPGSSRVHVWAEFFCINGILFSFPLLCHPLLNQGPVWKRGKTLIWFSIIAIFYVNIAMGARSTFLSLVAAGLLCLPLLLRRFSRFQVYAAGAVLAVALVIISQIPAVGTIVPAIERLQETDVHDEERLLELQSMLNYMGGFTVFGLGNGSGFPSPTTREDEDFAAYPHLSIFAPLQKGGVPAMLVLIIYPGAILISSLFRKRLDLLQLCGASTSVLVLFFSCISGNWMLSSWLYYGIGLGYCFYGRAALTLETVPEVDSSLAEDAESLTAARVAGPRALAGT